MGTKQEADINNNHHNYLPTIEQYEIDKTFDIYHRHTLDKTWNPAYINW